jgi:hypothetical protein
MQFALIIKSLLYSSSPADARFSTFGFFSFCEALLNRSRISLSIISRMTKNKWKGGTHEKTNH